MNLHGDVEQGLWLGPIPACRATVADVVVSAEHYTGLPMVILTMKPEWQSLLRRETERNLGQTLPVRLNGRVIAEPLIQEPIDGPAFSIIVSSEVEAQRISEAARQER